LKGTATLPAVMRHVSGAVRWRFVAGHADITGRYSRYIVADFTTAAIVLL